MKKEALLERPTFPGHSPLPLASLKPITCGPEICQDLTLASTKEWVITNGLGGYASSTILGMNTRRYHGLLVAATVPPVGRVVLLSKVEETVITPAGRFEPARRFELSTNRYTRLSGDPLGGQADVVHPDGYRYLVEFRLDPWPTFLYRIGEILLEKSIFLLPGENATVLGYTLHSAMGPVELAIRPLVAFRDFRALTREDPSFTPKVEQIPGVWTIRPANPLPPLMIHHTAELVESTPYWYKNFEYSEEEEKGTKVREDLWSPGQLVYLLKVGESCALVASTGRRGTVELTFHRRRVENTQTVLNQTMTPPGKGPLTTRLSWTADSFVAHRTPSGMGPSGVAEGATLMAGFPWLGPWGRDALVALPGLTLVTKRFDLARSILQTLGAQVKGGLIPVRLAEEEGSPEYDSADTSLWFFWAIWHYWRATRDLKFIAKKLADPMRQIMEGYLQGTHFGIRMDEDGLILLSDEELPLTWMDAREPTGKSQVPGRAVTPRFGKPVEVNALWCCALNVMGTLGDRLGVKRAGTYLRLGRLVQKNFLKTFLNPGNFLHDRVTPLPLGGGVSSDDQDSSIRPNMLIATSLPFSPIPRAQAAQVLQVVEKHLLTPVGVRTLDPRDPQYRSQFIGDLTAKSLAYHQGTVWAWLIGPYVSTVLKVRRLTPGVKAQLRQQVEPFWAHLQEGALGSVSELFDGDPPHAPRGSLSQAWSVGELLRALQEARLGDL